MALLNNGFRQGSVGRLIGATLLDGAIRDCINQAWNQSGRMDNSAISEAYGSDAEFISYPDDMNHPYAWKMPQTAGRMAAYNSLIGDGAVSANMLLTLQAIADLAGSGNAAATGSLIVQLLADLSGQGTISDADMKAFLLMVAAIGGQGAVSATISALAQLGASVSGSGQAASTLTGRGVMSADILSYGELTPEGIRDSVWNALSAEYANTGTMGEKLNDAGSASNPWTEVIESGLTAAEVMRLILAVQVGKTDITGTTVKFRDIADTKDRITATMTGSERTSVTLDGS